MKPLNLRKKINFQNLHLEKNMFMPNKDRILSASEAIHEATDQMMKKDKNLILIGEGINDPKGIFGTTINLSKKYGENKGDRITNI